MCTSCELLVASPMFCFCTDCTSQEQLAQMEISSRTSYLLKGKYVILQYYVLLLSLYWLVYMIMQTHTKERGKQHEELAENDISTCSRRLSGPN